MGSSLLADAAQFFKARDTPIRAWYDDDGGRYAFAVDVDGQRFVVAAKTYLHDGQASFMRKLVERAAAQDAFLLLFVQDAGKRLVFDADQVLEYGQESNPRKSKRAANGEAWLDVPKDDAVNFEDWVDYGETPTPTRADGGPDRKPARHWDITAWGDDDG